VSRVYCYDYVYCIVPIRVISPELIFSLLQPKSETFAVNMLPSPKSKTRRGEMTG
jgi:hypothetical protein